MREEQRAAAQRLLDHFKESIQLIQEEFDDLDLSGQIASAKENYSDLLKLYQTGVVFNYLAVLRLAPAAHESLTKDAVQSCETTIASHNARLSAAEDAHRRETAERRGLATEKRRRGAQRAAEADSEENSKLGYGCLFWFFWFFAMNFTIVFAVAIFTLIIILLVGLPVKDQVDQLIGFILLGVPSAYIFTLPIRKSWKKGRLRAAIREEGRKIIEEAETDLLLAAQEERQQDEILKRMRTSIEELTSAYRERIRLLWERQSEVGVKALS
jgi:hypothetical protein